MRPHGLVAVLAAACSLILVAGCSTVVAGTAVSTLYDPFRAGGLPAKDGPSGVRSDAPAPTGQVEDGDGGDVDRLALLAVNDVAEFWQQNYAGSLPGRFVPIETLRSYDSEDPSSPPVCGTETYGEPNAFYCPSRRLLAWDRGVLVPIGREFFGDVSIAALVAHEYGHAVQRMAGLADDDTPVIVMEQQADCFAGTYVRWVAEGNSPRFDLSTGDGLNHVLAAAITLRDPVLGPDDRSLLEDGHGTALDRVSAFQTGFVSGAAECARITLDEIEQRRGDLPMALPLNSSGDVPAGEVALDQDTLSLLVDVLGQVFTPAAAPTLSFEQAPCDDATPSPPASYCPATNTIAVDLAATQRLGEAADESNYVLLQGDNTALSVLTSRYALAVQHELGEPLNTPAAALRTACLTGVAQAAMAAPMGLADGRSLTLTAGDLDEAVAGLLTNGLAASNVDGQTVPAGFTRLVAYRSGLSGDRDLCFARFR